MKLMCLPIQRIACCWILLTAGVAFSQDFDTEIMPILTKSGCNGGACHGAAAGRGEFRLSLLGSDPVADHHSIVRDFEGRRTNLNSPHSSLLLAKPTGRLEHGGEVVLDETGDAARLLEAWVASGAKRTGNRHLIDFSITPQRVLANQVDEVMTLRAYAVFSDGTKQDVTALTQFVPADDFSISLSSDRNAGLHVKVKQRGKHVIIARYLNRVLPIELIVPLSPTSIELTKHPRVNFIDDEILAMLGDLRIPPANRADANGLVRRIHLDLLGRLPSLEELKSYEADSSDQAYESLVDRLLDSDGFADFWTLKFSRWLRVHSLTGEPESVTAYTRWIHDSLLADVGFDAFSRQLLTSEGDSHQVGPANFSRMAKNARDQAELVSQFFLGVRMECANCHNHPLDRWTQDDFHGLAAIFAKIDRGRVVKLNRRGAVTNPRTGEPAVPKLPGDRFVESSSDERIDFANWLTRSDNHYLARAMVNRLWSAMFGRGMIEPADDLRETNPATHPALLDRLTTDFIANGYRLRHTLKQIAISETYRRSHLSSREGDALYEDQFYSVAYYRPLEPEVLADAIADVTGVADQFPGPAAAADPVKITRAITLYDPLTPAPSLEILGRCSRASQCGDGIKGTGLAAKLHLINGELINAKLTAPRSFLHRSIAGGRTNQEIISDLYRLALCRTPNEMQLRSWLQEAPSDDDPERVAWMEDFAWSLLNSRDFTHNH